MTSVNQKTNFDPAAQFEDGMSVQTESKCTSGATAKTAEPAPTPNSDVDTFETVKADPRRAELERINAQRNALKPDLEKKKGEALRAIPKMIPVAGNVVDVAVGIYDAARSVSGGDSDKATKAGVDGAKSIAELEAFKKAIDAGSEGAKIVSAAALFKNAFTFYSAMREYGKDVKKDEELRHQAEAIETQLDPTKKFKIGKFGAETLSLQGGQVVSDVKKAPPTPAQQAYCDQRSKGK
ncbi:MAG TPA: hypothetical protein VGK67_39945 [Myxococcales bacterium]|jgi:hypothetical protein